MTRAACIDYVHIVLPFVALPGIGPLSTYAIVRTVYVVIALALGLHLNERLQIPARTTLTLFAVGVPLGIVGAHVLDMLEYADRYRSVGDLVGRSGSSIYGAFLVVFPGVWIYARWQRIPPIRLLDAGAPAMALGEAMTRIGCFLNGCCYGVPWDGPWAVTFPATSFAYADQVGRGLLSPDAVHSLAVHPVQLYSAVIMTVVFFLLLRMVLRPHRDGAVFFAFLVSYGVLRLGMAPLRQEALASMKVFSVLFIAVGTLGLVAGPRRARERVPVAKPRPIR